MNKLYNDTAVQAIANAIRAKNGSSDTYTIAEMSTALNDLSYYAKPTIENVPLATFEADGLPLNSLKVSVEAKQEGSGTPSPENVRPISGWSEVVVSDVGKNIINRNGTDTNKGYVNHAYLSSDGTVGSDANLFVSEYFRVKPNTTYTISGVSGSARSLCLYDKNGNYTWGVSYQGRTSFSFTTTQDSEYIRVTLETGQTGEQLEEGTTATTYKPYNGVTTTISLPQTVYGAEVDVVNGILKITDGYIASYNGETLPSTWISSMDEYAEGTSPTTGAEVVYTLASSTTVSLTPTLIKSLNGQNNLSVDCGEVIELEYFKEV